MGDMENNGVKKPSSSSLELEQHEQQTQLKSPIAKILIVASVGAGVQFSWALQLSLLTPYVQLLGIPHKWAAFIWLCGPISGMFVQPSVGYYSDRSTSRFGRRRPFIGVGAALVVFSVFLIGFAADLGYLLGDSTEKKTLKPRAVSVFVIGFWILDVANNTLTGPCRAFLADLSGDNHKTMRTANASFSFFLAVGNVLGYAAGSYSRLHKIFPFTSTTACDNYCANLKSCFLIAVVLLVTLTTLCLVLVPEPPFLKPKPIEEDSDQTLPFSERILHGLRTIPRPMWILLLVTCLNWIAWFPFFLFDTDWMGREVYGGRVGEDSGLYDRGVRAGTLGLMLNSVMLGFTSLSVGVFVRGRVGGGLKKLWGCANFLLAICLGLTVLITKLAQSSRDDARGLYSPPGGVKAGALALFAVLGIPLAVTYSIPYTLASIFSNTSGAGQGLSLGVLNLAIVIPQLFVSVASGPWDALFGGGNLPAFVVGAIAAAASGVVALTILPSPHPNINTTKIVSNGGHS